jgi:hypothetical protein
MADLDNNRDRVIERPRETVVVQDRSRRSVWRWLIPLLILLAIVIGLYIVLSPENEDAMINTPDTVNIDTPNIDAPNVDVDVNRTDNPDTAQ